ncbi:hypothetical protein [Protofrankia coriariae]|uniref:Uncharacterized protein n=1 Tax=Protofrankia coriariae TaxID=1562887 RepID=A0ABR5EZC6_9ACTN|nr:hypothetical protein [Protofrankia coriariae]KLL09738.1 hypothetical protein FrCorBMG51_22845 [Protofrankia coriariae]
MSEQQDAQAERAIGRLTIADPLTSEPVTPVPVPKPDREWKLRNGFAWVYYGKGSPGITRPVLMADGFNLGRSNLEWLYQGLEADFPLISTLRDRGRTVILLGTDPPARRPRRGAHPSLPACAPPPSAGALSGRETK